MPAGTCASSPFINRNKGQIKTLNTTEITILSSGLAYIDDERGT
ncbi:MAG: hypothetical protein PHX18_02555 [Candidatus Gastranaerophilales bacterium]|nr:hypothetical protein [Candidatus Gastranaerophilales bacterium]